MTHIPLIYMDQAPAAGYGLDPYGCDPYGLNEYIITLCRIRVTIPGGHMQVTLPISGLTLNISNPVFVPTLIPGEVQVQSYDAVDESGAVFDDYDSLAFGDLVTLEETLMQMAYEQSGPTKGMPTRDEMFKRIPRER